MQYTFNGMCRGTTKAGKQCQHRSVYANGLCKQHGGDSTEFMQEHFERLPSVSGIRPLRSLGF